MARRLLEGKQRSDGRTGAGMKRRDFLKTATTTAATAVAAPFIRPARAQTRNDTLLTVSEGSPNNLDVMGVGTNLGGYEASWNTYDRLVTFGSKKDAAGNDHYDPAKIEPELAESWDLGDMSATFKLRRDAKFHDGSPVTAHDVKWTFDRAVTVGGVPTFQMKAGSLEKPEQFVAVDDYTFRIDFLRKDKLSFPDLCVPTTGVINSSLAKQHATDKDPWAMEWLKNNESGGGAYRVEKWIPGQELTYRRFDDWNSGPLPKLQRVIWRTVPSAGNRRALLERGDADISFNLPPRDVAELVEERKLTVVGTPIDCCIVYIDMNVKIAPFDNVKVRQAVAHAIPYQKIMDVAMFGRGVPMFGGPSKVNSTDWPQPSPYRFDLAKAKQLLAEAGMPDGFETTLSFDLGVAVTNEPICVLVQESLGQIGIRLTLNKIPGANWRAELAKKSLPMVVNLFGAWLTFPEYFFYWNYHSQNSLFNTMSYQNPAMDQLIEASRFETDPQKYTEEVEGYITMAFAEIPRIPLFDPFLDVAMQKNVTGYRYWFHRQLDYRQLAKT
jgi:peptide/nickel transport system substrate-binding protein